MKARDYQQDCIDKTWADITGSPQAATLVTIPTGGGKTVVFAHLADRWIKSGRGRVLILAHRRELIDQAAAKFERVAGYRPMIEMANSWAGGSELWRGNSVVVGSVATMRGKRLERWNKDYFSLIITDEAHHATAPGYRSIYRWFDEAALVGVTATPDRSDKSPLGKVFTSVSFQMQILEAIRKGWLVPIRQKFVHVDSIDLTSVESNWKGDDLDETQLDAVMRRDENIHRIARPIFETAGSRPTLVFCTGVAHSKAMSDVLNSYRGGSSAYIASYLIDEEGGQKQYPREMREDYIDQFQKGKLQFLCSCGVFLEGFDAPPTALIGMARPTKSRSLYAQALGRGTRPLDGLVDQYDTPDERIAAILASAKPDCLVMDFVGNSGRHKLIYADDVLFPDGEEEVRERARKKAAEREDGQNVEEAMEEAAAEIEQEHEEQRIVRETEIDRLRRGLAKRLLAQFHMRDVDPFSEFGETPQVFTRPIILRATDKQVRYVLHLANRLGKRFDQNTLANMPKRQVEGVIGSLQRQLKARGVTV